MIGDQFTEFSPYTNPEKFIYLFRNLPISLEEINDIIHSQLIHPGMARELVTQDNNKDEEICETVSTILAKLQERNPIGLSLNRKPEHRVVNNCCGHSQLMAAILKNQGVPARLRCGFSLYPFKGYSCDHTVVEVLIDEQWCLIDPSQTKQSKYFRLHQVPEQVFHFGWQAWQRTRNGIDSIERYCIAPGIMAGEDSSELLRGALVRDLACIFSHEIQCWYTPNFRNVTGNDTYPMLDEIAALMSSIDENLDKLELYFNSLTI